LSGGFPSRFELERPTTTSHTLPTRPLLAPS
jgi:hypothetical protein